MLACVCLQRVEVLWIFNHQFGEWEDKLPAETKQQLLDDRRGQGIHPKGVMKREFMEGELWDFWGGGVSHLQHVGADQEIRVPQLPTCLKCQLVSCFDISVLNHLEMRT